MELSLFSLPIVPYILRRLLAPRQQVDRLLVSLPYSHYVESARWALHRRGLRTREIKVPVGPHMAVACLVRLLFSKNGSEAATTVSHSSYPGQGYAGEDIDEPSSSSVLLWILRPVSRLMTTHATLRRLAGVPLVVNARTDTRLADSWSVLDDCNLPVADMALRQRWDTQFGPAVRQVVYYYIFQTKEIYRNVQSCNAVWMALFDVCEHLFHLTAFMKRMLYMTPRDVAQAEECIGREFQRVSQRLLEQEQQHAYLGDGSGSDCLGGADIAFSALAGWLILPENFHGGHVHIPDRQHLPTGLKALMERIGSTRAAQHVRMCYQKHRLEIVVENEG